MRFAGTSLYCFQGMYKTKTADSEDEARVNESSKDRRAFTSLTPKDARGNVAPTVGDRCGDEYRIPPCCQLFLATQVQSGLGRSLVRERTRIVRFTHHLRSALELVWIFPD